MLELLFNVFSVLAVVFAWPLILALLLLPFLAIAYLMACADTDIDDSRYDPYIQRSLDPRYKPTRLSDFF
jgi:hypothetical protein